MKLTDEEIMSLKVAYESLYFEYLKIKRSRREQVIKDIFLKNYKMYLENLQTIYSSKLKLGFKFKKLK